MRKLLALLIGVIIVWLVACIAGFWALIKVAEAHGDADWIMDNPDTRFCCGPNDCFRAPSSQTPGVAVERAEGGGYIVRAKGKEWFFAEIGEPDPKNGTVRTFFSIDTQYWLCWVPGEDPRGAGPVNPYNMRNAHPNCLFVPALGT